MPPAAAVAAAGGGGSGDRRRAMRSGRGDDMDVNRLMLTLPTSGVWGATNIFQDGPTWPDAHHGLQ